MDVQRRWAWLTTAWRWAWRRWPRIGLLCVLLVNEAARVGTTGWHTTFGSSAQMTNGFFALPASQVYHVALTLLIVLLIIAEER